MPEIPLEGHQLCLVPDFFQKSINVFSYLFDFSQVKERLVQPTFLEPGKNNLVVKFTLYLNTVHLYLKSLQYCQFGI